MQVKRFLLHSFEKKGMDDMYTIILPHNSEFLKMKILHDGIYAFYSVANKDTEMRKDNYVILQPEQFIPINSDFIDILDTIVEVQEGQGILLFPIYKLR